MSIKIGYQGIEGSNSLEAAYLLVSKLGLNDVEYIPLISSSNVVLELEIGNIEYGVLAISNNIVGTVKETKDALNNKTLTIIDEVDLQIHHCIFKKREVLESDLGYIASHVQALNQTKKTRSKILSSLEEVVLDDTALAARKLADGELSDDYCVICSKKAGEINKLSLMYENVEDRDDDVTTFGIFKK